MTGLDKILERIRLDAKEQAAKTLEEAQNDCKRAAEEYAARAEALAEEINTKAGNEAEEVVETAKKTAEETHERIIQNAKQAVIDEAFAKAKAELQKNDFAKYRELLTALLTSTLIEKTLQREKEIAAGEATEEIASYEVLMNKNDRATYGESVVRAARCAAYRRIGAARVDRVHLGEGAAPIDSGLHLYCDEELIDLSLDALLADLRKTIEPRIEAILFPEEDQKTEA